METDGAWVDAEIDGAPPAADGLLALHLAGVGHYTCLQVRGGRARGMAAHRERLAAAHREIHGEELDVDAVLALARRVVARRPDCFLRISLEHGTDGVVRTVVVARPPAEAGAALLRLSAAGYLRPFAHLKHTGTFGAQLVGRRARAAGFDDALLVGPDGAVAETTIANVGFLRGGTVVWPQAPCLPGIAQALLRPAVQAPQEERPVHVDDLAGFDAAFACNSIGVVPVGAIDGVTYARAAEHVAPVRAAWDPLPWDDA